MVSGLTLGNGQGRDPQWGAVGCFGWAGAGRQDAGGFGEQWPPGFPGHSRSPQEEVGWASKAARV
jgi:hypothetical protein